MRKYLCGNPTAECGGSTCIISGANVTKAHSSSEEAFKCFARNLIRKGYTKVGEREYKAPNDGAILLLTKKSRFGTPLRKGKTGGGAGTAGSDKRIMTIRCGGCIQCC